MFLLKRITKRKSNVFTYIMVGLAILLITIYAGFAYLKILDYQYEKDLLFAGENYVHNINSSLERYSTMSNLMAMSFTKNIDNDNFLSNASDLIKTSMEEYPNIKLVSLVLNSPNTEIEKGLLDDSTKLYKLNFTKKGNKVSNVYSVYENKNDKFKRKIASLIQKEQTEVLKPKNIMVDNKFHTVFPIISVMYKGNYFLGYIILYITSDLNEDKHFVKDYEVFTFTEEGKLLSSNVPTAFFNDDISKICSSCSNNYSQKYQTEIVGNTKTICFYHTFSHHDYKWNICVRGKYNKFVLDDKMLTIWILGLLCIIVSMFAIYYLLNKQKNMWTSANAAIENLFKGDNDKNDLSELNCRHQDNLKHTILHINDTINTLISNNKKILSGSKEKIETFHHLNEELDTSSAKLYSKFKEISKELQQRNNQLQQLKKVDADLDIITDLIQKNHSDVVLMMDLMIQKIVSLLDFEMGAVFFKVEKEGEIFLEQIVSYAYNEKKSNKVSFKLGSSLVGACAAEKRIIYLKKIPQDYLKIISGLGNSPPKTILILPLLFENDTLGVIELGSLRDVNQETVKFIEKITTNISVVLSLTQANARNNKLLEQSESDKRLVLEQYKNTKESLAELQKIQNKTIKSEAFVKAKLESVTHALIAAEYNPKGILKDVNFKFINTFHFNLDEVLNKNIAELISDDEHEVIDKIISSVKLGSTYEAVVHMVTNNDMKKAVYSVYTPLFDDTGTLKKILFFGVDLSGFKISDE